MGPHTPLYAESLGQFIEICRKVGAEEEIEAHLQKAIAAVESALPAAEVPSALAQLGGILCTCVGLADARIFIDAALELLTLQPGISGEPLDASLTETSESLRHARRFSEAEELLRRLHDLPH